MANKQGTNQIVDAFIGDKLIEARYIGSIKYFDAYTEITSTLPLSFNSRAAGALKNYRVFGTAAGAGIQTINLLDVDAKDTANGYVADAFLSTDGSENPAASHYAISEYIPVFPSTRYSICSRKISGISACFYNVSKEYISGVTYTYARPRRFTSPSNAAYLRMTILEPLGKSDMLLEGNYDEEPAYEPFGYKIPLALTTEVTEEMFDKDAKDTEKGFVSGAIIRSNGNVLSSGHWCVSEYIPIEIGVTYRLYWGYDASSAAAVAFYDTNKEVLGGYTYGSTVSYAFTPDADGYLRFSYRKDLAEETSLSTSEQISDNYPLFIGNTKLGEEEYTDFGEQKVYKRTENLWNPVMDITTERYITSSGSISSKSENYSVSDFIPMSAETEYTISSITTVANAAAYHAFYDANQDVIETMQIGKANQSNTFTTPQNCAYARFTFRSASVSVGSIMLVEGSTLPETFIPYLQPTDPPTPLPAIIAYQGENTLSDPMVQTEAYSLEQGNYGGNPGEQLFKHNSSHDYFNKTLRIPSILTVPAGQKWLIATKNGWATTIRIADSNGIIISMPGTDGITTNPIVIEASTSERKLGIHSVRFVNGSALPCVPSDYGGDLDITVVDAGALESMTIKGRISETT